MNTTAADALWHAVHAASVGVLKAALSHAGDPADFLRQVIDKLDATATEMENEDAGETK